MAVVISGLCSYLVNTWSEEKKSRGHDLFLMSFSDLKAICTEINCKISPNVWIFCKLLAFLLLSRFAHGMRSVLSTPASEAHLTRETRSRRATDGRVGAMGAGQLLPLFHLPAGPVLVGHSATDQPCDTPGNSPYPSVLGHATPRVDVLPETQTCAQADALRKVQNQLYLTPGSDLCPLCTRSISWCRAVLEL